MALQLPELDAITAKDQVLGDAISKIVRAHNSLATSLGASSSGVYPAPAQISQLIVTSNGAGLFNAAITDNHLLSQKVPVPINYFVEYSTDRNFANPPAIVVPLGPSRNKEDLFLGNRTLYFRANSSFFVSNPSPYTYHGGAKPAAVIGGGAAANPQPPQGSGSNPPGLPGGGFGTNPIFHLPKLNGRFLINQ
jgi:hypothetical protein